MMLNKYSFRLKTPSIRFLKYFSSYVLLVVLLLLVIGSVVYSQLMDKLQQEIEQSNQAMLRQIRDNMDLRMQEMHRISIQISTQPQLTPFMITQGGYESMQMVRELKSYMSTNSFLHDLVLYYDYQGEEKFYAASGAYRPDLFFDHIYRYDHWGSGEFLKTIDELKMPLMRPVETMKVNGVEGVELATFIYPLKTNTKGSRQVVLYMVKGSELQKMIQNVFQEYSGFAAILDQNGTPIVSVSSGDHGLDEAVFLQMMMNGERSAAANISSNLGEYSVVKQTSEYTNWSYVVAMPTDQMVQKINDTKSFFYWTAGIVLILGMFISYIMAWGVYRPIRQLVNTISGNHSVVPMKNRDELVWISNMFDNITGENQGLRFQLKTESGMMKDQLLLKLLQGSLSHLDELNELATAAKMRLEGPVYAVLWFWIDDYEWFVTKNNKKIQNLLRYSIINVVEELSLEIGNGYAIDLNDVRGVVLLINMEQDLHKTTSVNQLARKTKDFFQNNFPFTITVGVSDYYEDLLSTPKHFRAAQQAASYRYLYGNNKVYIQQEIPEQSDRMVEYRVEQEIQITRALIQGQSDEVELMVKEIMGELTVSGVPLEHAEKVCAALMNTVQKCLYEFDIQPDPSLKTQLDQLFSFKHETIEQFEMGLIACCRQMAEYNKKIKESKNFELRDRLMQYMDHTFSDPTQCLDKIANEFTMSPSYMTRYFKDQTGYSLIEYLDQLRMKKAKELLRQTNLTVKDIAGKVGYTDVNNFNRKFKKKESITPTEYKRLMLTDLTSRVSADARGE